MLVPSSVAGPQLPRGSADLDSHEDYYWSSAGPMEMVPNPQQAATGLTCDLGGQDLAWYASLASVSEVPPAPAKVKVEPPSRPPREEEERKTRRPKIRTVFTQEQLLVLHQRFQVQHYLTPLQIQQVSAALGLTAKQVKTWFQNRRMKLKRFHKDGVWLDQASWITQVPKYGETLVTNLQGYPPPAAGGCVQRGATFTQSTNYSSLSQVNYGPLSSFMPGLPSQHPPYYANYSSIPESNPPARQDVSVPFYSPSAIHYPNPGITPLYTPHPFVEDGDLGLPQQL